MTILISGDSQHMNLAELPDGCLRWRIRCRIDEPDTIFLSYEDRIEQRYLDSIDDFFFKAGDIVAINRHSIVNQDATETVEYNFWNPKCHPPKKQESEE